MKNFKILLFAGICFSVFVASAQGRRSVDWVHGLGEGQDTWAIYEAIFTAERCMNGYRAPGYTTGSGIQVFANQVSNRANSSTGFPRISNPRSIAIGHSMGSLAIRRVDQMDHTPNINSKRFGGIITVGGPNKGAGLVNSYEDGQVAYVFNDACNKLAAGPISELPFVLSLVANGWVREDVCDYLEDSVINPFLEDETGLPNATELKQNSEQINNINMYTSTVPRISIWGNETGPVHWRIASSFATQNQNDFLLVAVTDGLRGQYELQRHNNQMRGIISIIFGFWRPQSWFSSSVYFYRGTQWKKGRDWFDRSENLWNGLTRCHRWETTSFTTTYNPCMQFTTGTTPWINCLNATCPGNWAGCFYPTTYTTSVFVRRPSDGFVCDDSQILDGLPTGNVYEARGVNHSEETNTTHGNTLLGNDEMQDKLREIWTRPQSDFFYTPTSNLGC